MMTRQGTRHIDMLTFFGYFYGDAAEKARATATSSSYKVTVRHATGADMRARSRHSTCKIEKLLVFFCYACRARHAMHIR